MKLLIPAFLSLLCLTIMNCEGRTTQRQALQEDIEEYNKNINVELHVYEPESYVEQQIDTLFHNGFRVKIKTYSDMQNDVLLTKIKDTINYQTHYRNYKFDILIEKDGKPIYADSFDKEKTSKLLWPEVHIRTHHIKDFKDLGVLKSLTIDKDSAIRNDIKIDIIYEIPGTNKRSQYALLINPKGILKVEHLE